MVTTDRARAALERLINRHGVNLIAARSINPRTKRPISRQAVELWKAVPLVYCKDLAKLDGCEVKDLRPDLWELLK